MMCSISLSPADSVRRSHVSHACSWTRLKPPDNLNSKRPEPNRMTNAYGKTAAFPAPWGGMLRWLVIRYSWKDSQGEDTREKYIVMQGDAGK